MNRKEYRKKKLEWFEYNSEMREGEQRQRKKEWDLFKERASLDMQLTRLRIIKEQVDNAIDKVSAKENSFKVLIDLFLNYLDSIEKEAITIEEVRKLILSKK